MTVPGQRQMSQAGIGGLIETHEGCELKAYKCPAGIWTIGYGHTGRDVTPGLVITQQRAEELLEADVQYFEQAIDKLLGNAPTTQAQFDAMVSLAFNIGMGSAKLARAGFATSSVLRKHLLKDYAGAADSFLLWNKGGGRVLPGLVNRRAAERAWYLLP
jgi:lysozyme